LSGSYLTNKEISLIKNYEPFGFILFSRNYKNIDGIKNLIKEIKNIVKRDCPILIDQEGGKVQRLSSPHFLRYPPSKLFGDVAKINMDDAQKAVYLNYSLIGNELINIGINVNCAPCIDVTSIETHSVIGDRAFSSDEIIVAKLGKRACEGLMDNGVIPVIKHIPGHGKANLDSHKSLPIVKNLVKELEKKDFYPFQYLSKFPMAMTAHIVYSDIDSLNPITTSEKAYKYIRNEIHYDGILITDDICMKSLSGSIKNRIKNIINAKYDLILHCSGNVDEMKEVLKFSPVIDNSVIEKWNDSLSLLSKAELKNKESITKEINNVLDKHINIKWNFY